MLCIQARPFKNPFINSSINLKLLWLGKGIRKCVEVSVFWIAGTRLFLPIMAASNTIILKVNGTIEDIFHNSLWVMKKYTQLPLFIHRKLETSKIGSGKKIWKKPYLFTLVWHLFSIFKITMKWLCFSSLCYNNFCTKTDTSHKINITSFLRIQRNNREIQKRILSKGN